ncbi:sensor histidine kinase [Candidatus Chrysopegis kryptomonas]|uniref:histidine kinase n=1 Tax=Candidatus Chryseopegocella kryptomonas TaxID=1633643 RepID=A0A0P1MVG9_9BACT|nr:ATP-binding protein [Candidatus Chrysopegis kryptomonas]CUS99839.1 heavy metal sensor kinase [Candidatus Chrysopegis kryptomonas]
MLSSIKLKLSILYSLALLFSLAIYGALAYFYMRKNLLDGLDNSLKSEIKWIKDAVEPKISNFEIMANELEEEQVADSTLEDEIWDMIYEHSLLSAKKQFIQIRDKNGKEIYRSLSLGQLDLPLDSVKETNQIFLFTVDKFNSHKIRLAVLKSEYLQLGVAYPIDEIDHALANLFRILVLLIPVALLISIVGGIFLAGRSLKPVDDIVKTAREITAGNLSRRIPEPRSNDEIARLIKTLNDMIDRLEKSFERMKQFSADVSHEFKTPLTIIRGEIELALSGNKRANELKKTLVNILDEVVRLSNMVDDLLTLYKSDVGQIKFDFKEIELDVLLKDLLDDVAVLAEGSGVKIKVGKLEKAVVSGDEMRLKQLFLNLIDNAIKYNKIGGEVLISVENKNGFVEVSISDTGIGIPDEEINLIFERFYRVDKARSRGGVGLGLSIAKWIVESHNGKIEVESKLGQGSKFKVILPSVEK